MFKELELMRVLSIQGVMELVDKDIIVSFRLKIQVNVCQVLFRLVFIGKLLQSLC